MPQTIQYRVAEHQVISTISPWADIQVLHSVPTTIPDRAQQIQPGDQQNEEHQNERSESELVNIGE